MYLDADNQVRNMPVDPYGWIDYSQFENANSGAKPILS